MSPEQWLAQQNETTPQPAPSPEEWMAQQKQAAPPSPEQWLAQQEAKPEEDGLLTRMGEAAKGLFGKSKYQDVSKVPMHERNWLEQQVGMVGTGLEIGLQNTKSAILNNQIAGIAEVQEARKSKYGAVENMPADVREKYTKDQLSIETKLKELGDINTDTARLRKEEGRTSTENFFQLQQTPEYKNADFWEKSKMVGSALMQDPLGVITDLGLESLPSSLTVAAPTMLMSVAKLNPAVGAAAGGYNSMMMEFGNQYTDLRAQGMPHGEAWEKAGIKAGVVGLFDAASFHSAGKAAGTVVRELEQGTKHGLLQGAKEVGKEVGKQAAFGAAGEGLGSVAIGEEVDPGKVLAEAVGEVFGAPGEAVGTYQSQQQQAALRKALLGEEPPPQVEVIGQPGVQAERVEPTLEGPIEEPAALTPQEQMFNETVVRYMEMGLKQPEAEAYAAADVKEAEDAGEFDVGTSEPSIQVPSEEGAVEPGAGAVEPAAVDGAEVPVQGDDGRQEPQLGALEAPEIDITTELPVNADGTVTVYHHTSAEKAAQIRESGQLQSAGEPDVYVTTEPNPTIGYGDTVVPVRVDPAQLQIDDEFPDGRKDYRISTGKPGGSVPIGIEAPVEVPTEEVAGYSAIDQAKGSQIAGVLMSAAEGYERGVQEYAETGKNTTMRRVNKYLMDYFTPLLGKKDAQRYTNYLVEEGGLDGADYGSNHELYEVALGNIKVHQAAVAPTTTSTAPTTTSTAPTTTSTAPTTTSTAPTIEETVAAKETPTATKGKRGRKAKTPEEKAATKAAYESSGRKKYLEDVRYRMKKALDYLQTADVDETSFPDTDEGREALDNARTELEAKQVEGAKDIYRIAHDPQLKGTPNQKKAKELFDKWSPQEKKGIEAMVKDEDAGVSRAEVGAATESGLVESTDGQENGAYLTFNNAVHALSHVRKTGNAFEKALAQRIGPFLQGVKLVIVHDSSDLPKNVRSKFEGAVGMYDNRTKTIYLSAEGGLNNTVFLHEAVHGATISKINQFIVARDEGKSIPKNIELAMQELNALMMRAKNFYAIMEGSKDTLDPTARRVVDNMDEFLRVEAFDDVKEFVAYGFTHPAFQEFLHMLPGRIEGKYITRENGFSKFVDAVRRILGMDAKHDSALQDLIVITDTLIGAPSFKGPDVSMVDDTLYAKARIKRKGLSKEQEKVRLSILADNIGGAVRALGKIAKDGHKFEDYKTLFNAVWDAGKSKSLTNMLKAMQTTDILRWKGDEIAGLHEVDKLQQQMSAFREHLKVNATKKAEAFGEFVRKYGQKTIGEAMHMARLHKFSPQIGVKRDDAVQNDPIWKHYNDKLKTETDPKKAAALKGGRTKRAEAISQVYAAWDALGKQKGGQEIYDMVRKFYRDNYNATRRILDDQLDALPIDDDAKARLMKSVRLMYEQGRTADTDEYKGVDGETIKVPRAAEDYFPFRRYGDYWLEVKGPKGREFYMFESEVERNLFQNARAKEIGAKVDDGTVFERGNDVSKLRQRMNDSSIMLQKMFADIDSITGKDIADVDKVKDELKDQLYQTYLMTLPERSFRKQFLHAEEVTGFSSDVFRNFKATAVMYSNQLAKLKYGVQIEEQILRARDYLEGMDPAEAERHRAVIDEIADRARDEINPTPTNKAVQIANQFAYYWLLTSAASAATQFLSMPIVVMPTLNGNYGVTKPAALFTKYMTLWNSIGTQERLPGGQKAINVSFGTSKMVQNNPLLKAAFDAAVDRHVTTITNTSVLTNLAATPERIAESRMGFIGKMPAVALRHTGTMFSGAERLTREMTYLMAFELEYAKNGGKFDEAVEKAITMTYDTLGRYDSFNRAKIMRNAVGRTVGQFKQYAYTMTSFFIRNLYNSVRTDKSLTDPERVAAVSSLTGTLAMGWLFAGIGGMPAFSAFCLLMDVVMDSFGDDDEDKKKRRAETPFFANDSKARFLYEWLPENFGQITVPGIDGRDHKLSDIIARGPASVLSDIDFGSRTGWDNMWFKGGKVQPSMSATLGSYAEEMLGPAFSGAKTVLQGVDDLVKGDYLRGLEGVSPAILRTPIAATRMATEGAETRKGMDVLSKDELNALNIVMKGIGYSPTRLTELQQYRFNLSQEIKAAQAKHSELLSELNQAVFDEEGGGKKVANIVEKIEKFNRRYPGIEGISLEGDTIDNSLATYAERKGLTYRGIYLDEKLLPYFAKSLQGVNPLK